ncbi:hypothetical protein [Rhizobium sp. Rhizsp42]|uniref:hypothetical protein n=1 Tax=Rhizobium sp. Rhizsp42 TaxID=3243034 RepID=UPI0039B00E42
MSLAEETETSTLPLKLAVDGEPGNGIRDIWAVKQLLDAMLNDDGLAAFARIGRVMDGGVRKGCV